MLIVFCFYFQKKQHIFEALQSKKTIVSCLFVTDINYLCPIRATAK